MANTALNRTGVAMAQNKSGASVAFGDIVVLNLGVAASFTTTAVLGYTGSMVGVCMEPNGIANDIRGLIAWSGWVPIINLSATAAIGDFIRTSGTVKLGVPHLAPALSGDFAEAWGTGTTPEAYILTPIPQQATQSSVIGVVAALPLWIPRR